MRCIQVMKGGGHCTSTVNYMLNLHLPGHLWNQEGHQTQCVTKTHAAGLSIFQLYLCDLKTVVALCTFCM